MTDQQMAINADAEFDAMHAVLSALEPLPAPAKARVLGYFIARFNVNPVDLAPWLRAATASKSA